MPDKIAKVVELRIRRLEDGFTDLHKKMDDHLKQSGEVLTNIEWLKQAFWILTGAFLTGVGAMVVLVVKFLLWSK